MNINKIVRLHEKAGGILELIQLAESRIKGQEENIKAFGGQFQGITSTCEKRIEGHKRAQKRLLKSYDIILAEIFNATNE